MSGSKSGKGKQAHLDAARIVFCLLSPSHSNHRVRDVDQSTEAGLTRNHPAEQPKIALLLLFISDDASSGSLSGSGRPWRWHQEEEGYVDLT